MYKPSKGSGLPAVVVAAILSATMAFGLLGPAIAQPMQAAPVCGWIGVQVRQMTGPVADSLGMSEPYGAIFDRPEVSSPAAGAGIQEGDVVTRINGTSLMNWRDFAPTIAAMAPGTAIYLDTWRDALAIQVNLTVASGKCPPVRP